MTKEQFIGEEQILNMLDNPKKEKSIEKSLLDRRKIIEI